MMNCTRVRPGTHLLALVTAFVLPALASAQDVVMTSTPDKWQFSILGYLWAPTIKGSLHFPIANTGASFNLDPNDIFNNINAGFMGSFGVQYNRWGFFTDMLYMDLGKSKTGQRDFTLPNQSTVGISAYVNLDMKAWIVTSAVQYRVVEQPDFIMSSFVGARYLYLKPSLSWYFTRDPDDPTVPRGGERSISGDKVDAIIGFKGQWMFGEHHAWALPFYADVGGGGSKLTWQLAGGVAYHWEAWEFGALYRKINYHINSSGVTDLSIAGPMIGAVYRW
jgi:hypothetical protein